MRFACTVQLFGGTGTVKVGFRKNGTAMYKWSQPQTGTNLKFTLYNFEPGVAYNYKVALVSEGTSAVGAFSEDPALPDALRELAFTFHRDAAAKTNYVLFDTWDCTKSLSYLVAYDAVNGWIAWYQDIYAETGYPPVAADLPEWSYTPDHTILAVINKTEVFEWGWDGAEIGSTGPYANCDPASPGGPCPHHDAARSADSGDTFVITGTADATYTPADTEDFQVCSPSVLGFLDDGVETWDGAWAPVPAESWSLKTDFLYDPTPTGAAGPSGPVCGGGYWSNNWGTSQWIDWTHVNAIHAEKPGAVEYLTVSSKELSEIFQYAPATGNVMWTLNGLAPERSTLTLSEDPAVTGYENFGGQHHVTFEAGHLQMFDNRSDIADTSDQWDLAGRGIRLELTPGTPGTAEIVQSFVMREWDAPHGALDCTEGVGSAVGVPMYEATNMLLNCGPQTVIEEVGEADGTHPGPPLLYLALDHSGGKDYCTASGMADSPERLKFYRAWPIAKLGDF